MNDRITGVNTFLQGLAQTRPDLWRLSACGVTPGIQSIPALVDVDSYLPESNRVRLLVISGLRGEKGESELGLAALERFRDRADELSPRIALTAVPWGNPEGNHDVSSGYPPQDNFYNDPQSPEKRYLWRWTCFQAPDLLLEIRPADSVLWSANPAAAQFQQALGSATNISDTASLPAAVGTGSPCGLAPIPGLILETPRENLAEELDRLWDTLSAGSTPAAVSPARRSLESRYARSYMDVARILASVYGYQLDPVNYTQGVGISGRLRLAALEDVSQEKESPVAPTVQNITSLVEPYVSGSVEMFGDRPGGANLAGLIWGEDLSEATGDHRYTDLIVDVADRYRSGAGDGAPPPCDPDFRTEDMFMAGAILGRAFDITGELRYIDLLVKFLIDGNIQQEDGLFWHCRSAPFYWGRGNGFAAMGLTETLTFLPEDHPGRGEVLAMCRKLLDALGGIQDLSGMLPQVLDCPGSYQEFTATCMYGYALARGLRLGWLDSTYRVPLDLAWRGVSQRVDDTGNVVDGCASTGVQSTLKEYLDRPAVFGFDDRSGGMALWFAVEMERLRRGKATV